VFDGSRYHAFYLSASRARKDPIRRHRHPIVGHAVSTDLVNWEVVVDALIVSESPAFDSYTTWTGSVVKGDDGLWWMYYTGTSREDGGMRQTVRSRNLARSLHLDQARRSSHRNG
jgi:beta-fructofuranosidase